MNVEIKFSNTREYLCKTNKNLWQVKEKIFYSSTFNNSNTYVILIEELWQNEIVFIHIKSTRLYLTVRQACFVFRTLAKIQALLMFKRGGPFAWFQFSSKWDEFHSEEAFQTSTLQPWHYFQNHRFLHIKKDSGGWSIYRI